VIIAKRKHHLVPQTFQVGPGPRLQRAFVVDPEQPAHARLCRRPAAIVFQEGQEAQLHSGQVEALSLGNRHAVEEQEPGDVAGLAVLEPARLDKVNVGPKLYDGLQVSTVAVQRDHALWQRHYYVSFVSFFLLILFFCIFIIIIIFIISFHVYVNVIVLLHYI
jgi:hypothetical protein